MMACVEDLGLFVPILKVDQKGVVFSCPLRSFDEWPRALADLLVGKGRISEAVANW